MAGFLERLFGKKEPEGLVISFGSIPSWLDSREKTARSALTGETEKIQGRIRQGIQDLRQITETVARAEHDEELHPKLRSIAKNSLPQYIRAMNASLSRDLPDDIDKFYPAAVECLKSCLNSTRGQGRYLHAVFPEEMKAVKAGIDAIGRDLNEITASLTRYRKEKDRIDSARALHTALLDISEDIGRAEEKDQRIVTRIGELSEKLAAREKDLAALSSDEGMSEVNALKTALKGSEDSCDAALRSSAALSMTASHVFRRAEKIAVRQKHPAEIALLRHAMELLSDHEAPQLPELSAALAGAFPIAERMIAAGEITLKNKEERAIFADTRQFCSEISSSYASLGSLEETCRAARERLESHPLLVRGQSLEREKAQVSVMLKKEELARTELKVWLENTKEKIPHLTGELIKILVDLIGGGVQLQIDDQRLARG